MHSKQQAVEESMAAIFDNLSIHPSGVVTAWHDSPRGRYIVKILPKRENGVLWGWKYSFRDPEGNETVSANTEDHARVMIGRIQRWRWSL